LFYLLDVTAPEQLVGEELADWYALSAQERWLQSEKLWETYLALGGSLGPEPDSQSPFFDAFLQCGEFVDGRPSVRLLRRSGV